MKNKKYHCETMIEIAMLVLAIFSFSYFAKESFGAESSFSFKIFYSKLIRIIFGNKSIVSAQENNQDVLQQELRNQGYIREGEDPNPEVINDIAERANRESEAGGISEGILRIFNLLQTIIPSWQGISGTDFQRRLLDSTGGIWTCPLSKDGKVCQEYTGNICRDKCSRECIEGQTENFQDSECSIGVCKLGNGLCSSGAAKWECENNNHGTWFSYSNSPAECKPVCCKYGNSREFITEGECRARAESLQVTFGEGVTVENIAEDECMLSALPEEEGACIFPQAELPESPVKDCKFVSEKECKGIVGNIIIGENFHPDKLCSNPELNTRCEQGERTSCVEDLDGVYWFDSCGNRENIYDSSRDDRGWNNGVVLPKEQSCEVSENGNEIANQATCGNCNRFLGTTCKEKTDREKLDDENQNYVCKSLSCSYIDAKTGDTVKKRHGESWCAYQGSIGLPGQDFEEAELARSFATSQLPGFVQGLTERSTDTPGSTHYRMTCLEGEVKANACENARSEICEELRIPEGISETFSQAYCIKNRWQECLSYNPDVMESQAIGTAGPLAARLSDLKVRARCSANPYCFVKTVDLTNGPYDTFKFSYCAPRYPPGFDVNEDADSAEKICSQASNTCTAVWVKELWGGWTCKANCECVNGNQPSDKFVNRLNEFCTSLGDCGLKVNYQGDFPGTPLGYNAYPGRMQGVRGRLYGDLPIPVSGGNPPFLHIEDATPTAGEYIQSSGINGQRGGDLESLFGGSSGGIGEMLQRFSGGGSGEEQSIREAVEQGVGVDVKAPYTISGITGAAGVTMMVSSQFVLSAAGVALNAYGGAASGIAIGLAVTAFLIDITGVGRGLDPFTGYGLMTAGAVSGGFIAYSLANTGTVCQFPTACIVAVAVIVIILLLAAFGIGEVEERKVTFECRPWSPPNNGDCSKCNENKDVLSDGNTNWACNKYACESLGQNCKYITESEGSSGGRCESVDRSDATAPRIESLLRDDVLTEGFFYRGLHSDDLNDLSEGFKIRKENDGCLNQFEVVKFGFRTDEYATACILSANPSPEIDFEQMKSIGIVSPGGREFKFSLNSIDLAELGVENLEVEQRNEINLALVCQNLVGVDNAIAPYTVDLCIIPSDVQPPLIEIANLNQLLAFTTESYELEIPVNELSECRWSYDEVPYEQMSQENQCRTEDVRINGLYSCKIRVPLTGSQTEICVKCKDHPEWQGTEREGERKANTECTPVKLTRVHPLKIDSVTPDGDVITVGRVGASISIDVIVRVSEGLDGTGTCYYQLDNFAQDIISEGKKSEHRKTIPVGGEGRHTIRITCNDGGANPPVEKIATFTIVVDMASPTITRVYNDAGTLTLITDEGAGCGFVNSPLRDSNGNERAICDFSVGRDNIETFSFDDTRLIHRLSSYNPSLVYYIRCADHPEWTDTRAGERNQKAPGECDVTLTGGI